MEIFRSKFVLRLTLEEQLRAMQKRLAEIAAIPIQIQATLENVTKTMENLLPERSPEMSDNESDCGYEEIEQYDDSYRFDKKDEEDSSSEKTDADDVDPLDTEEDDVEEEAAAVSSASVSEICDNEPESGCASATPEDLQRPDGVWSSWPWSEQPKAIPRRSNCHLVPRTSMIQNRIKLLNEKQVLAPYTRSEHNVGN
ncbi:uncharacterized protein LOC132257354 [Phlebotomus argentipes]|uniref:uncharacterized protein LOC132257354 n=1 Tax=Phlebotomus argentipes TaxID=94469 RepID=UPI002892FA0F|nr:uncharacterized protein LOC132257354 [Phlebotomus argentipes]